MFEHTTKEPTFELACVAAHAWEVRFVIDSTAILVTPLYASGTACTAGYPVIYQLVCPAALKGLDSSAATCHGLQVAYGAITVETTGQNYPLLTGALCSICISAIVCAAVRPGHTCALTRFTSHYIISASFPGFYIGHQTVRRPGMLQEAVIVCIACCCTDGILQSTL